MRDTWDPADTVASPAGSSDVRVRDGHDALGARIVAEAHIGARTVGMIGAGGIKPVVLSAASSMPG